MKNIGFIDYYLDEWHANNYPTWIKEASNGEMKVAYAYGLIDSPHGGLTTKEWCEKHNIIQCNTIVELIEKSDCLVVLSPDNCEMHEQLCQLPVLSGKPTFVDKTFAPGGASARRILAAAEKNNTPLYSTSALRYADEYKGIDTDKITAISSWGPHDLDVYSVHQLEPLIMLMKCPAKRVMCFNAEKWINIAIEFTDGRMSTISCFDTGSPFMMNLSMTDTSQVLSANSDFFKVFIEDLVDFFNTKVEKVAHSETIAIMDLREACILAHSKPCEWINIQN